MARKGAGITIKVNRPFTNESGLANMSYYRCGDLIQKDVVFDVCEFNDVDLIAEMLLTFIASRVDYVESKDNKKPNTLKLDEEDIKWIVDYLFDSILPESGYILTTETYRITKQQIRTLVYIESLMYSGLVEVEWYDWW